MHTFAFTVHLYSFLDWRSAFLFDHYNSFFPARSRVPWTGEISTFCSWPCVGVLPPVEDLFSISEAHSAAPTLEVTINALISKVAKLETGGRTGKEDGRDGDQVQSHGDGAKRRVCASSFVDHLLFPLRVPALELEVSLVVAWAGLHTVVAWRNRKKEDPSAAIRLTQEEDGSDNGDKVERQGQDIANHSIRRQFAGQGLGDRPSELRDFAAVLGCGTEETALLNEFRVVSREEDLRGGELEFRVD